MFEKYFNYSIYILLFIPQVLSGRSCVCLDLTVIKKIAFGVNALLNRHWQWKYQEALLGKIHILEDGL